MAGCLKCFGSRCDPTNQKREKCGELPLRKGEEGAKPLSEESRRSSIFTRLLRHDLSNLDISSQLLLNHDVITLHP
jgi:hypothetical protein